MLCAVPNYDQDISKMSSRMDILKNIKFESVITVSTNSYKFVKKEKIDEDNIGVSLSIEYAFLRELHKAKLTHKDLSYIDIVNSQLKCCQLLEIPRLEERFSSLCYKNNLKYRVTGRKRKSLDCQIVTVAVYKTELCDVRNIACRVVSCLSENVILEEKCKHLFTCLSNCKDVLSEKENTVDLLKENNEQLHDYIGRIQHHPLFVNQGTNEITELSSKQVKRKLTELKSHASKALWFAETFGLTPKSLHLSTKTGKSFYLDLDCKDNVISSYNNLCNDEKEKLRKIVFLLDKFCVSDAVYHELAVLFPEMPRKYMVVKCRTEINSTYVIYPVPGNIPGAMLSFRRVLEDAVRHEINVDKDTHSDTLKLRVKFSGDGAKVSRISNFVIFSLCIIRDQNRPISSANEQRTISILNCREEYCNFRYSCKPMFDEINQLLTENSINIDDKKIEIEFFLGGDMKFLQIVLGLNSSQSKYSCIWCKVEKDQRGDTSKPCDYYHSEHMLRSMDETVRLSSPLCTDNVKYGVKHKPLLYINTEHIVMDELHLMLRITDILIRNLIDDCNDLDIEHKVRGEQSAFVQELVQTIKSCGVSFEVWSAKEGPGIELNWTSLTGVDKKTVLKLLPLKLCGVIHEDTCTATINVWKNFATVYDVICGRCEPELTGEQIFEKCKEWVELFVSLGCKRKGYQRKHVTPYMHCLLYHVPIFISKYGSLSKFSGQGVEKTNDEIKKIHQRKCQKWSATAEALRVRKRIEEGNDLQLERQKRAYEKRKVEWWQDEIFQKRGEMRVRIKDDVVNSAGIYYERESELEKLSTTELKEKLNGLGISTKVRSREKMLDILREHM